METMADRIARLQEQIARAAGCAGRDPTEVELIAVSKTVEPETVKTAFEAGLRRFGENRAQEFVRKTRALADLAIDWHFIGYLQTNKVRQIVPGAALIHSVDRLDLAEKLARRVAGNPDRVQPILVQVNITGEGSKSGVSVHDLPSLLDGIAAFPELRVDGLMTIGPLGGDRDAIRQTFRTLRETRDRERESARPQAPMPHLSMGMSGDFDIAIEEGATLIRVGTAIFGERSQ